MKRDFGDDRGTIGMFVAIFSLAVFLFAGLLVDGGLAIHARQRAFDIASQAARAGADNIDVEELRETGEPAILVAGACDQAQEIIVQYGNVSDTNCAATPEEVTVEVTMVVGTTFLKLVGIGEFKMAVESTAHPEEGA